MDVDARVRSIHAPPFNDRMGTGGAVNVTKKMRRIRLYENGKLVKETRVKFHDWHNAEHWVRKILKWKGEYELPDMNGMPF